MLPFHSMAELGHEVASIHRQREAGGACRRRGRRKTGDGRNRIVGLHQESRRRGASSARSVDWSTTTAKLPVVARSDGLSVMVNWLALLEGNRRGRPPLKVAEEVAVNPVPRIVKVNGPAPAWAEGGERPVMAGTVLVG